MSTFSYAPPANQNDFAGNPRQAELLLEWSGMIGSQFRSEIESLRTTLGQQPLFFSEMDHALSASVPTASVPWVGFPRILQLRAAGDRTKMFQEAEKRGNAVIGFADRALTQPITQPFRQQDEYLEWVLIKNSGRPVKYAFTAEGPEYWEFLGESDAVTTLRLYSDFAGRNLTASDISWSEEVWVRDRRTGQPLRLYKIGDYNPYNKVNLEECAAHLTHPANTLGAEINLAARATVQRMDSSGNLVTERRRLACCSNFGDPNRNSDPLIGAAVNSSVRGSTSLTLADPVGLYIQRFDSSRVADSNGNALEGWWRIVRGKEGRVLRAEFGPPTGSPLTLADVRVGNDEPLTSGGQLAELVTMVIYARAVNLGVREPAAIRCTNRCCVKRGSAPDSSELTQVRMNDACPGELISAYPEIGHPSPLSPFDRRLPVRATEEEPHG